MSETTDSSNSIEDVTIHSLKVTMSGLEALRCNSLQCADLLVSDSDSGLAQFKDLAGNIRDFYVFENDIRSIFGVDGEGIRDASDDLKRAEETLAELMADMVASLDANDLQRLAGILKTSVPEVLDRFLRLLPLLRQHIINEHVVTTC
ncbi:MAG: hypothetical protein WCN95_06070 [bacterium]